MLEPRLAPLLTPTLENQPRAIVLTVGLDPLCDEGLLYAERLEEVGTEVERIHIPAMIHGFVTMYGFLPRGEETMANMCSSIRRQLRST